MINHGWIIYNGHLAGNKFRNFAEWLQEAAEKRNIKTSIIENNYLFSYLTEKGGSLIALDKNELPDFVLFGDKDIHLAQQIERTGVPVYNSASAIATSDNKISTYQKLAQENLPIPKTIVAPKIFPGTDKIKYDSFIKVSKEIGFPLVIKEAYGSFGEQVYLIRTEQEMMDTINQIQDKPFVLQEFISSSYGRDVRLNVVGSQVVAAMLRTSADDFRANVSAGGHMETYHPTDKEKTLAVSAAKAVGADFAGIDILFGPQKQPIICEVNSNAHISNIYDCTKINVADYIIDHVIEQQK